MNFNYFRNANVLLLRQFGLLLNFFLHSFSFPKQAAVFALPYYTRYVHKRTKYSCFASNFNRKPAETVSISRNGNFATELLLEFCTKAFSHFLDLTGIFKEY